MRARRARTFWTVLVAVGCGLLTAAAMAPRQASIRGTVTDTLHQAIPGAWVTASGTSGSSLAHTSADGAYRIEGLEPGNYDVRAGLAGFCDDVRREVALAPGERPTVNLALRVAPLVESIFYSWTGFRDAAGRADAILHVRFGDMSEPWPWPIESCGSQFCRAVSATVLSVAGSTRGADVIPGAFSFLWPDQRPASAAAVFDATRGRSDWPIRPGGEAVAFLQWVPRAGRFVVTDAGVIVPIENGKVAFVVGKDRSADGREVGAFLTELRKLAVR